MIKEIILLFKDTSRVILIQVALMQATLAYQFREIRIY